MPKRGPSNNYIEIMSEDLLHRRLMMQQQGGGLINGYVADGLMLYLDGIDKGGTSGVD